MSDMRDTRTVTVVVNGQPVSVPAKISHTIRRLTLIALAYTDQVGRPNPADWEMRTEDGGYLDPDWDVAEVQDRGDYNPFGRPLFLSLRAGIGGVGRGNAQ